MYPRAMDLMGFLPKCKGYIMQHQLLSYQIAQYLNSVSLCPLWLEIIYDSPNPHARMVTRKYVPTNYRAISLLHIVSKILECHIHSKIMLHLQASYIPN